MILAAIVIAFFVAVVLGVPIAFGLGISAIAGLVAADLPLSIFSTKVMNSVDAFPYMAIPFFMLAGELMVVGGIMERLIAVANALVGHFRGGLAQVTIMSGLGLSTVSGAAVADAAALGSALGKPMGRVYGTPFSSAVIAASANLGPIIPPSTAMIIFATLAGPSVSIAKLFAAGVLPGAMIAVFMMIAVSVISRLRGYPATNSAFSLRVLLRELSGSLLVLMMPVIVIGGTMFGFFTATEAGAIAVTYAVLLGLFVTRRLKFSHLPRALLNAVVTTAVVGTLIAFASTVTYLFSIDRVPEILATAIQEIASGPTEFLIVTFLLLIVVGMFIEPTSAYIMLVPVFFPMVAHFGVDPIQFSLVFILTLIVGMLTPPVGTLLFVMCSVGKLTIYELLLEVWPFVLIQFGVIILVIFLPDIFTWLPALVR